MRAVSMTAADFACRAWSACVRAKPSKATTGSGLKMRDASVVRGIGVLPVFAGLLGLLLLVGALAATWAREGR